MSTNDFEIAINGKEYDIALNVGPTTVTGTVTSPGGIVGGIVTGLGGILKSPGDVISVPLSDFDAHGLTFEIAGDTFDITEKNNVLDVVVTGAKGSPIQKLEIEICYLRGTHILTPTGELPIENLRLGDSVITRFGGMQTIKWIGRQSFDARFIREHRSRLPVCIHAHALGQNMPARDLYVSPGHSLLLDGQLVLARCLVNGITITQEDSPPIIDYFNIELENHDCLVAEGVWAESFADGPGLRDQFHNAAAYYEIFPDEAPAEQISLCAPRPESGPALDAALRPVVARAASGAKPGNLNGYIDTVLAPWKIKGWAQDAAHPELPVLLDILIEDRVIGTILACDYREDLAKAGIGQGRCAFSFTAPFRLRPEHLSGLRVRRAADGADLPMGRPCREFVETLQAQTPAATGLRAA